MARENKRLIPTELGTIVTDIMKQYFSDIVDLTFTADMEEELDEVEEGKVDWHKVINDFYGPFKRRSKTPSATWKRCRSWTRCPMCPATSAAR